MTVGALAIKNGFRGIDLKSVTIIHMMLDFM